MLTLRGGTNMADNTRKIIFSPPDITEEEIGAVGEVLRSGWITTGPRTKPSERLDCLVYPVF